MLYTTEPVILSDKAFDVPLPDNFIQRSKNLSNDFIQRSKNLSVEVSDVLSPGNFIQFIHGNTQDAANNIEAGSNPQQVKYIQQTQVAPVTLSAPATTCDVCSSGDSAPTTTLPAPVSLDNDNVTDMPMSIFLRVAHEVRARLPPLVPLKPVPKMICDFDIDEKSFLGTDDDDDFSVDDGEDVSGDSDASDSDEAVDEETQMWLEQFPDSDEEVCPSFADELRQLPIDEVRRTIVHRIASAVVADIRSELGDVHFYDRLTEKMLERFADEYIHPLLAQEWTRVFVDEFKKDFDHL